MLQGGHFERNLLQLAQKIRWPDALGDEVSAAARGDRTRTCQAAGDARDEMMKFARESVRASF